MTNIEYKELKTIDYNYWKTLDNKITDSYRPLLSTRIADGVTIFLYYLGYVILITLFQNLIALGKSRTSREYQQAAWYSLFGFNFLFFLYFFEIKRYKKYFNKSVHELKLPDWLEQKRSNEEFWSTLTNLEIDQFKTRIISTIPSNINYKNIGLVYGSAIRAKSFTRDFGASVQNAGGGKVTEYTRLMNETRNEALENLIYNVVLKRADDWDLIVNTRMATSQIANGASEIIFYGTLIKLDNPSDKEKILLKISD